MKHPRRLLAAVLASACLLGLTACGWEEAEPSAAEPDEAAATQQVVTETEEIAHPKLIAHAGGAIYGLRYTNSMEALDRSYESGQRFMELDFGRSSDGAVVLIHDWEDMAVRLLGQAGQLTKEEFLSADVLSDLTLMDLERLKTWMDAHPDAYIITDVKEDNLATLQEAREILGQAADRLIPQVYSPEEYTALIQDGWPRAIFTIYRAGLTMAEVEEAALTLRPWGLTMPLDQLDADMLTRLQEAGIYVYSHTVNSLDDFEPWQAAGLYGIYSDYLEPMGFPY